MNKILLIVFFSANLLWGKSYIGYASYYGIKFNGNKTASGEILNIYKLTAAHKTLPFGTKVKVTFLKTGKSVIVRINDRGPFSKNRIIDLTDKAAQKIGLLKYGTGKVKIDVLEWLHMNLL